MNKKVLIISNEPLSNRYSNGRTLRNLLLNIPKEQIAQFFLHGEADETVVSASYRVTDQEALNALLMRKNKVKKVQAQTSTTGATPTVQPKKVHKNCKTMVLRDIVWRSYAWWKKDFDKFIEDFNPDVLLLQAGDSPFMYAITLKIANKFKLPIVMYNSEEYVLKKRIYSRANEKSIWHKILLGRLKRVYKKLMDKVSYCIYTTEYLEDKYQKVYPHLNKSCALYTASELSPLKDNSQKDKFSVLYCGNLGVGRVIPLDEFARVLYEVDQNAVLEIYGKFQQEEAEKFLCKNKNVYYGGTVPYEQVPDLMSKASMLLHTENADRLQNLLGAFSTKIADSLASGRPFLVYAINEYPFVQYLKKYDCAHIAADKNELKEVLTKCISDMEYRKKYIPNALKIAKEKHNTQKNCEIMENILNSINN